MSVCLQSRGSAAHDVRGVGEFVEGSVDIIGTAGKTDSPWVAMSICMK